MTTSPETPAPRTRRPRRPLVFALLGILSISFAAIFFRLSGRSPVTATFFRGAYALPILLLLAWTSRRGDTRRRRDRGLAVASGLVLAIDLAAWHQSIEDIGTGLGTVLANVQVLFVALLAWAIAGERPTRLACIMVPVVLAGIALISGVGQPQAYGARPLAGVCFGVVAGLCYAGYLLMFRASNRRLVPSAGPLADATLGMIAGALLLAPFDPEFTLRITWPAHGWLLALALICQVGGWLLIATALPRLPAIETSVLLLTQPIWTMVWGMALFDEQLSRLQWGGAALVLAGVAALTVRASVEAPRPRSAVVQRAP